MLFGQVNVSLIACNAIGLDAVQRLEQKKRFLCFGFFGVCLFGFSAIISQRNCLSRDWA